MTNEEMKAANEALERSNQIEKMRRETQEKKIVLEHVKVKHQFEQAQQAKKEIDIAQKTDFATMSPDYILSIQQENQDYINAARGGMSFINDAFKGIVPFFRKNLILIGGKTGEGKSTTVANIAYSTICQRDPVTGKFRRALIITNEERSSDVYNRITCLHLGWPYTNHDKITPERQKILNDHILHWTKNKLINVIDSNYNGNTSVTTTIEGIRDIFESLLASDEKYDVIIIDYYQKISTSKNNLYMRDIEVQAALAHMLDNYKNLYPAPIILMAQVKPPDKEETPFEIRIKGRKVITDPATVIIEMIANRERRTTGWKIHKSRFNEFIGHTLVTGYDKGKYVIYDNAFQAKVNSLLEKQSYGNLDKLTGKDDSDE